MRTSSIIAAAVAGFASIASAAPLSKRYTTLNDYVILQYALTLEHLEDTFYRQALAKYSSQDFVDAGFGAEVRTRIEGISSDETTHVAFLTGALTALGQAPVAACTYDFGYTSVATFLATASILEGVGVSAYLGAAASIVDKTYLTAAGAILTVESRHSSYIRNTVGENPFPEAFDIPLDFDEVYSLASLFITACPSTNDALPVKAFPALTATPEGKGLAGGKVKLTPTNSSSIAGQSTIYAAFIGYPTNQYGVYNPATGLVEIPETFAGQTYVVLTTSQNVTDDTILAGPAVFNIPS